MMDIGEYQKLNSTEKIIVTQHGHKRMAERGIMIKDIMSAIQNGEIIEEYPDDFPFPSCLILGIVASKRYIHVVASINSDMINIITAYFPNLDEWEPNMKTRKVISK